jgi:hypothetical protein
LRATFHALLIFLDFIILIISDECEKSLGSSLCIFLSRLWLSGSLKGFSIVLCPSAAWFLLQGTATETNYTCLHTAFEGWRVRGEVHELVVIWNTRNFLRD